MPQTSASYKTNALTWPFLAAFGGCCVLFWWLQSILLHFWLGLNTPIEPKFLWISAGALAAFSIGYILPIPNFSGLATSPAVLDRCENFSFKATIVLAAPAFLVALQYAAYRFTVGDYFEGEGISLLQQAVLYLHLFFGLLYISTLEDPKGHKKRLTLIIFLTIAPRVIVALEWRRFFAAQAVVPIILIALARGWFRISFKRLVQIGLIGLFILFVPALTRGDNVFGQDEEGNPQLVNYFGYMNTLIYFQDNTDLTYQCPPLLVSLTAKIVPYSILGVCTIDLGKDKGFAATLDRLLAKKYSDDIMAGTGGNYLLELYLTGGLGAILLGSAIFGYTCRLFVVCIGYRSLYAAIWAECLSRALFAPRQTIGYVYERIPSEVLAILAVVVLTWAFGVLRCVPLSPTNTDAFAE